MLRKTPFVQGEYYHIYNRGADKRTIFKDEHDHRRFVLLLYLANCTDSVNISTELNKGRSFFELIDTKRKDNLVSIGAYCLMPNHFHILLTPQRDSGVSDFMKKISTGYSLYFNKRHERTGTLFEGRFKAKHVADDTYLKYLYAYIHLNPIKIIDPKWKENHIADRTKAEKFLQTYQYSSYIDYMGLHRKEGRILDSEVFPKYFEGKHDFKNFIQDWLRYDD